MWLIGQYSVKDWVVCVICRVLQPPDRVSAEKMCIDREWCLNACREKR